MINKIRQYVLIYAQCKITSTFYNSLDVINFYQFSYLVSNQFSSIPLNNLYLVEYEVKITLTFKIFTVYIRVWQRYSRRNSTLWKSSLAFTSIFCNYVYSCLLNRLWIHSRDIFKTWVIILISLASEHLIEVWQNNIYVII